MENKSKNIEAEKAGKSIELVPLEAQTQTQSQDISLQQTEESKESMKLLNEEEKKKELSYDEILSDLGYGKYNILIFIIIGLIGIGDGAQQQALSILLPILQKEWNFRESAGEFLGSSHFLGVLIGSLLAGPVSDKYGRRTPLLISAALTVLIPLLQIIYNNMIWIIVLRGFYGALIGFIIPISFTMLAENLPTKNRGKFLTLIGINIAIGELFSVLLAKLTLNNLTSGYWKIMLVFSCAPVLLSFVLIWKCLNESIRWDLLVKNYERAFHSISEMAKMNKKIENYVTEEQKIMIKKWSENQSKNEKSNDNRQKFQNWFLFKGTFKCITPLLWFAWFVNNMAYFGALFTFPKILVELGLQKEQKESEDFASIVYGILGTLPAPIIAALIVDIKYLGRKNSLSLAFLLGGIVCLLVFFAVPPGISFYIAVIRFSFDLAFTLSYEFTAEVYPTLMRTTGLSVASSISRFGSICMPWVALKLMAKGVFIPYILFGILSFLAAIATFFIPVDTRNIDLDIIK